MTAASHPRFAAVPHCATPARLCAGHVPAAAHGVRDTGHRWVHRGARRAAHRRERGAARTCVPGSRIRHRAGAAGPRPRHVGYARAAPRIVPADWRAIARARCGRGQPTPIACTSPARRPADCRPTDPAALLTAFHFVIEATGFSARGGSQHAGAVVQGAAPGRLDGGPCHACDPDDAACAALALSRAQSHVVASKRRQNEATCALAPCAITGPIRTVATGLSLIELLVVVAIVAILALAAVPAYRAYVLRAHRVEATVGAAGSGGRAGKVTTCSTTSTRRNSMPRRRTASDRAPSPRAETIAVAIDSADASTFTATATALGDQMHDVHCARFGLDAAGARSATHADCWSR